MSARRAPTAPSSARVLVLLVASASSVAAAAGACSTFSGTSAEGPEAGGLDGDPPDGAPGDARTADEAPADAGCLPAVDCTKIDAAHCDGFDIDPLAYWSTFVTAPVVDEHPCGRVLTAHCPASDAGQSIQMLARAVDRAPEIVHFAFDVFVEASPADFPVGGYVTVFEYQRGAASSPDGYIGVDVDRAGANVFLRGLEKSVRLEVIPKQWNHIDVTVDFAKDYVGNVTAVADGRSNRLDGATLLPEAGSPTTASMVLGLRCIAPVPEVGVRIDNFVLY